MIRLSPFDPQYPRALLNLDLPPELTLSGPLDVGRAVAIVGSRGAEKPTQEHARQLAYFLAKAGVIVISGGAVGVDRAAHEGALDANGVTWLVSPAGHGVDSPPENADLFRRIEGSPRSRMIWPFKDKKKKDESSPRYRNGVLIGLAECVVVIQAAQMSGSRNAATWARELGRPIYIVPGPPYDFRFMGTAELALGGARPIWSFDAFFKELGLPPPDLESYCGPMPPKLKAARIRRRPRPFLSEALFEPNTAGWNAHEKAVFSHLSQAPIQQDDLVQKSGLEPSSTLTALLTLSLKDVVVEGPDGFFRRRTAP